MAKFVFYAATALCALFGAAQAQNATTPAPTAARPACGTVNFTAKATDFRSINNLISLAISSGMLSAIPSTISVNNSAVAAIPFKLLNLNFDISPTIKDLQVTGVQTIIPKYVNATSINTAAVAADFNGTVGLKATFSVSIQQLDLKWYSICWTDAIHTPFTCPPAVFDVEIDLAIVKPGVVAAGQFDLAGCAVGVPRTVCKDITASDITIALINQSFAPLLTRFLTRFKAATFTDIQIKWDSITKLDINILNKGTFINYLLDKVVDFSVEQVNKMGDIYNTVVSIVDKVIKSVVNKLVADSLAPKFGNNCYDE